MNRNPLAWGLVCLLGSVACNPTLSLPNGSLLLCTSDAQCPAGYQCLASRGRCVASNTELDETPPALLDVKPETETRLTLAFSEPLRTVEATTSEHYSIGSIDIEGALLNSDLQTVQLITSPQESGKIYTAVVRDVYDLEGNRLASAQIEFVAAGLIADTEPPTILAPPSGARVFNLSATLIWTTATKATSYLVEVSSDSNFSSPIAGSPFTVLAPETSLTVDLPDARTYWWRVRADVSTPGRFSESTFEGMGDAVYVYCPAGPSCDDTGQVGNKSKPFRTIGRGLAEAKASGIPRVNVAARGNGSAVAYSELVSLQDGVSLYGGYDDSLSEANRDPMTNISMISTALPNSMIAFRITAPSIIDGMHLVGKYSNGGNTMWIAESSANLVVRNCVIRGSVSTAQGSGGAVRIDDSGVAPGTGPLFEGNYLLGGTAGGGDWQVAVSGANSSPTIRRNFIRGSESLWSNGASHGIYMDGAPIILNNIVLSGNSNGSGDARGILLGTNGEGTAIIANNTIITGHPGATGSSVGIWISGWAGTQDAIIANNLMVSLGGNAQYGFYDDLDPASFVSLENNLIIDYASAIFRDVGTSLNDATPTTALIDWAPADPSLVAGGVLGDNYTLTSTESRDDMIENLWKGHVLTMDAGDVGEVYDGTDTSLEINTGCDMFSVGEYFEYANDGIARMITNVDCAAGFIDFTPALGVPSAGGILVKLWGTNNNVIEDLRPKPGTLAATGGKNAGQDTCGVAGLESCGGITNDFAGLSRTAPYSIGALERD